MMVQRWSNAKRIPDYSIIKNLMIRCQGLSPFFSFFFDSGLGIILSCIRSRHAQNEVAAVL